VQDNGGRMLIGVVKEIQSNENRVAITPNIVEKLIKLGYSVQIESNAGVKSNFTNQMYEDSGAKIVSSSDLWESSNIILKINSPEITPNNEIELLKDKQTLISFFGPAQNPKKLQSLARDNLNILSMDSVPRISRAQKMDALSSMANIAGSRAVIEASYTFGRFFGGQITAAGKIPPAKILIIGAGVAGLSAIGTATSLGAIVRAFDTRPEVKEQVESLNAEFLTVDIKEDGAATDGYAKEMSKEFIKAELALFKNQCKEVDIIITTALIPGKQAPKLITEDMVEIMKPGSVIVDLASSQGGNCAYTQKDKIINHNGVNIIGFSDLPSRLPSQSSQLYATNLYHVISDLTPDKDGNININMDDEVIRGMTVIKDGKITYPPPPVSISATPTKKNIKPNTIINEKVATKSPPKFPIIGFLITMFLLTALGSVAPSSFMNHFTVFVLSCFIGYMVVWNVTASLHTPLMSVTNAVSSIIIIGALTQISSNDMLSIILASIAILIASINIFGGFAVTKRMLEMFRK
jgi:NAD(P) transhydrogenase subunit alpha|tara:strand:- start:1073 stop:2638 length:1566 start_codon:yes stop_codon:yes gene_type:complete